MKDIRIWYVGRYRIRFRTLFRDVYIHIFYRNLQEELGIEYTRYLRQVIETLEKDETFKKKLENAQDHDIKVSYRVAVYSVVMF